MVKMMLFIKNILYFYIIEWRGFYKERMTEAIDFKPIFFKKAKPFAIQKKFFAIFTNRHDLKERAHV